MSHLPKPNFTAWFVMQGVIAAMHQQAFASSENNDALALYRPLSCEAAKTRLISRLIAALPYGLQYRIGELVTNRGRLRHFLLRKREIEARLRAALDAGEVKQVVVLGAGLDVLSFRLAVRYRDVTFIEIDTKESQDFKRGAFAAHGVEVPPNVQLVEGDLRHPLAEILAPSTFKRDIKTAWIAEGFFMFIPEDSVRRIFEEMKALSSQGLQVIFTTLEAEKITSSAAHLLQKLYLKKEKSPFEWVVPFDAVAALIGPYGYEMVAQICYRELHERHLGRSLQGVPAIGENIHMARCSVA